jgi:gliding motility-associated-like protein
MNSGVLAKSAKNSFKLLLLFFFVLLPGLDFFAQAKANWWYFGANAGLNFNPNPAPVAGGQINTIEGVAAISDAAGNRLFYTEGMRVWNRNHIQMPNGFGLLGSSSSTQSGVIVQRPGSNNIYYIFTADAQAGPGGLRYSEVDMNLAAGFGDVTANKNILLYTPTTERVCAIRHCNNVDIWVLTHHWGTNQFRAFLVTAAGVNTVPVVSAVGAVHTGSNTATIGYLKASPDGSKVAMAIRYTFAGGQPGFVEMYDFNSTTGVVSNPLNMGNFGYAYGVEFSPNSQVFYCNASQPGRIYQFNLCAGTNAQIVASMIQVGTSATGWLGGLQLGPDNKIYMGRFQVPWLGVINNPNTVGMGCNYVDNGQTTGTANSTMGLPNFPALYFRVPPVINATMNPPNMNCLDGIFAYTLQNNPTNCNSPANTPTSILWNFGDPNSGPNNTSNLSNPTHTFSASGNYTVTLILTYPCYSDTATVQVTAVACGPTVTLQGASICQGNCTTLTATPTGGNPPYTYAWTPNIGAGPGPHNVCPTTTTTYTVVITDATGLTSSSTATIQVSTGISIASASNAVLCNGGNTGTATATPSGSGPFSYQWSNGQTTQTATGLSAGNYTVTVTDAGGCSQTATITVAQPPALITTTTFTNISCNNGNDGTTTANPSGGTAPYTYSWSNGQTTQTATALATGTYTVTVTDANGCTQTATATVGQPTPIVSGLSLPPPICVSQCATLTAAPTGGSGGPYTFTWNPGNLTGNNVQVCPTANTTYTVTITDAGGCTSTDVVSVMVRPPLTVLASGGGPVCPGAQTQISANGSGGDGGPYNYLWSPGNMTGSPVNVNPNSTTTYTVTITDNCGSPSQTATVTVNVFALTPVSFAGDTTQGCSPLCVTFTNNSSATASCSWTFGNNLGNSQNCIDQFCFVNPGGYNVTLNITDNNGCTNTLVMPNYIVVHPNPSADFTMSSTSVSLLEPTVCFNSTSVGATVLSWNFGDPQSNTGSNASNPCHTYSDTGRYCVTLAVRNSFGCPDTVEYCLDVLPDVTLFVPNAFTPNGDGFNATFFPQGVGIDASDFKMWIFDRWGNMIWSTTTWGEGWDGKANGGSKVAQEDVYVWKIRCKDLTGKVHDRVGHVSLIR